MSLRSAVEYLETAQKFQLGELTTEASHPTTRNLSEWSQEDLPRAYRAFFEVDRVALQTLCRQAEAIEAMKKQVRDTLASGGRIFVSGCGATGRLALTVECLWREHCARVGGPAEAVLGFMAGGDIALIRSIESFEDHTEFGERQLRELGFAAEDLLLAVTEGGETSFVIGSALAAAQISRQAPYFLYCNPEEQLLNIERSRHILKSSQISCLNLCVGPMALSGSTRLQATTVQLLAVLSALFSGEMSVAEYLEGFLERLQVADYLALEPLTVRESQLYQESQQLIYSTRDLGVTLLTDTTERSPTFSLHPFENFDEPQAPSSLCYMHIQGTKSANEAWQKMLWRTPRTLDWPNYQFIAGAQKIPGYDFSDQVMAKRCDNTVFEINRGEEMNVVWRLQELHVEFDVKALRRELHHVHLKLLLNVHSTVLMGRLERYQGNWMTWVKPSNGKLIDRAIRYVLGLARQRGQELGYEDVAQVVFEQLEDLKSDESIVLKTLQAVLQTAS